MRYKKAQKKVFSNETKSIKINNQLYIKKKTKYIISEINYCYFIGCLQIGTKNRRHAWDFPTVVKSDSFKLGNLLDRKHGFEKLNQEASDEEPNASTTMLSSNSNSSSSNNSSCSNNNKNNSSNTQFA